MEEVGQGILIGQREVEQKVALQKELHWFEDCQLQIKSTERAQKFLQMCSIKLTLLSSCI